MNSGNLCAEKPPAVDADTAAGQAESDCQAEVTESGDRPASDVALTRTVYGPDSSLNGFEALEDEWNRLLKHSRYNTVFLTYEWQSTWWEYLGKGELWIVAFHRPDNGALVGIAPLFLTTHAEGEHAGKRVFSFVGCIEVSDYLDILAEKGWEKPVFQSLHEWLFGENAPDWETLDLCNLPEASRTYRDLPLIFDGNGATVQVSKEDVAPQFSLPQRYESYLEEMVEKKQRHEIRRKQRRAEREADVGFHIVGASENLTAEMDDFVALQQASREDKAEFMTAEMRRFFGGIAQRMREAGYLRLAFLTINGEKAASLLAFEYDRQFLLYNSGYDPDAYSHLSPGWVLLSYSIQYAIATGCRLFDFMQGDEAYKYHFGSHDFDVMRVIVHRL